MVRIDMDFPPQHSLMFQTYRHHHQEDQEHHQFIPSNSPNSTSLNPSYTQRHFDVAGESFMMKRSDSFSGVDHHNENNNHHYSCHDEDHQVVHMGEDNELSDDGLLLGEKKRRLNLEQVKTLEKSFELGNKLDPERKMQLAKALGLQPRQISIWFQNRRARSKTKQLEKDYHVLKKQFDSLRADNDSLQAHNKQLLAQLSVVKSRDSSELGRVRNQKKEGDNQASWSNNGSDNSSDININLSRTPAVNTSSSSHEISGKNLFPSTSSVNQHLQTSTTISDDHLQGLKLDHNQNIVQDHGSNFVCNMLSGIEEQQTFWAWPDQHHFH